jgi:hypothetical protein
MSDEDEKQATDDRPEDRKRMPGDCHTEQLGEVEHAREPCPDEGA